ncbi:DUF305 domain-containing protein [Streptomyces sp. NBC_00102]|uniref:DUF305 domain-containing protein n=1 Tax=Streptomyces sp. NBC_00102 TaxID=2975652 RepID=UPI002259DA8D|nr:DUF305 domain-containing protein [Streptomyces sp. NBC_00102]MCX5396633.1 DUF305 domain-containing protein [Streptomyces sp. NBC_00102]
MTGPAARRTRQGWAVAGVLVLAALVGGGTAALVTARSGGTEHGQEQVRAQGYGQGSGPGQGLPAVDSADAGFAQDMAVHHQQAVEMSFVVRDGTHDEDVRRLAYDIARTQSGQRGMLLGWLDLWGLPKVAPAGRPMAWMHAGEGTTTDQPMEGMEGMGHGAAHPDTAGSMTGMATRAELERLGAARGRDAEVLYLQLMTDHHKGGITMARSCAERCAVPAERRLAQGMMDAQQAELDAMADLLAARGARPRG